ncbi:MAG: hypothetical protein RIS36_1133 [Pseudomonadota bacterium]|jgi:hypothetical protein
MRESGSKELSEQQELLLSSYVDNECSFIARMRAERLIKQNENAKLFVHNLKGISQTYRSLFSGNTTSPDLWDRISQRIDGEERAALYLGQRKPETLLLERPSLAQFFSKQAVLGGLSGAAIAACVLMFVSRPAKPGEILPVYTGGPVAAHNASAFHQASLGSAPQGAIPGSSMEVDWMRSNGSLKIIQNPTDNSAIFWVRKRPGAQSLRPHAIKATPTIRVLGKEGLDVIPLGTTK